MEQIAVVKRIINPSMAEIAVQRETACGAAHSCAECAGCEKMMTRTENIVKAFNDVEAGEGDVVKVRSENATFFKTAAIVYILPLVLAMVTFGISAAAGVQSEGIQILCAGLGFVIGILIAVGWDRHMRKIGGLHFHIVEIKKACSGT